MTDTDKRRYTRVPFDAEVVLHDGGSDFVTDLIDISFKGLLVSLPDGFELDAGAPCDAELELNEEVRIVMHCTLAHRTGERLGLRIDRIDMDSLAHLRRLLELNLGDPELLDRELSGLGH
jgi:hypothetical protein